MYETLSVLALFAFGYSVCAGRIERASLNGAVVYVFFGVVAGPVGLGLLDLDIGQEGIRTVAELTLALVLFTDASNADFAVLRRSFHVPQRLLLIGLPLTILLGVGLGSVLFPGLSLIEVAILATMLAPTDAALGKAVVTNAVVPADTREALNVESGLNDGICVPILFTFLALASETGASGSTSALVLRLVAEEIGIGIASGVGLTVLGAAVLRMANGRGWVVEPWLRLSIVALAIACFGMAEALGGSGFIACFTGGLAFGALANEHKQEVISGAEGAGEALSLVTWVIFGAAVVLQHDGSLDWRVFVYALLSLTVVRMLPVLLSVVGLGISTDAKLFVGWFGPRGLASVVFLVIVAGENLPGNDTIVATTVATVVLSILAHGISANPLVAAFGARAKPEGVAGS